MTELANSLIGELRTCGEKLPMSLRERIVSEGPALIPTLIDILLEEEADNDDDWSSIHIVDLLADLNAEDAIQPMLRVLAETDWDFIIHDRIILRLPELGTPVLEPALSMLAEGPPDDVAESLCAIVSQLGVRDERVFEHLVSRFPECPEMASGWLADYGDERGLPLIEAAIVEFVPDGDGPVALVMLNDLVEAYERLAGALPAPPLRTAARLPRSAATTLARVARARSTSAAILESITTGCSDDAARRLRIRLRQSSPRSGPLPFTAPHSATIMITRSLSCTS